MLTQALSQPAAQSALRPLHPWRDLRRVAVLVELVFREELALLGDDVTAEMRRLAAWGPLLYLLGPTEPFLTGFVWEQEGEIIGNINLAPARPESAGWIIGNLAVHPLHRRRGIARQLLQAALDFVALNGGQIVLLQVDARNEAAKGLYRAFGFAHRDTWVQVLRPADVLWPVDPPRGLTWRPYRAQDRKDVRELIRTAMSAEVGRLKAALWGWFPSGSGKWWADSWEDLWRRQRVYRLVIEEGTRIAAYLEAQARPHSSHHRLGFVVRPGTERIARALVQQGLYLLGAHRPQPVFSILPASDQAGLEALASWGFWEARRLDVMTLELAGR